MQSNRDWQHDSEDWDNCPTGLGVQVLAARLAQCVMILPWVQSLTLGTVLQFHVYFNLC